MCVIRCCSSFIIDPFFRRILKRGEKAVRPLVFQCVCVCIRFSFLSLAVAVVVVVFHFRFNAIFRTYVMLRYAHVYSIISIVGKHICVLRY